MLIASRRLGVASTPSPNSPAAASPADAGTSTDPPSKPTDTIRKGKLADAGTRGLWREVGKRGRAMGCVMRKEVRRQLGTLDWTACNVQTASVFRALGRGSQAKELQYCRSHLVTCARQTRSVGSCAVCWAGLDCCLSLPYCCVREKRD